MGKHLHLKSFLQAIDPEVYVNVQHVDGTTLAFNVAESIVKIMSKKYIVVGACPEYYPSVKRNGISVLVDDLE